MNENKKKTGFGKQLAELHRWNGWLVVLLAVTGLVLSWGAVRGWLGEGRVWIKQLHIGVGVVSGILLVMYAPLMRRHWKQIRNRPSQKRNLSVMLILLVGWLLSGIVLWQFRHLPPRWANNALVVHDLLTWVGMPYILFHSITRIQWMRRPERRTIRAEAGESAEALQPGGYRSPTRHNGLRVASS
ncbi:hypothetical protein [Cohnella faecalis]|nr:hypothetical protein [Cohnella faecalis]